MTTEERKNDTVSLALHGPGVTLDKAIEAGQALKNLLYEVGESVGVPRDAITWEITNIGFQCDGCGLKIPNRPVAEEGWTYSDGDDFCPSCSAARSGGNT